MNKYLPKSNTGKGVLLTLVSCVSYFSFDRIQYNRVKDKLEEQLLIFGSQPINATDPSDKLKIYIAPSFYALNWFDSYIRPFLYIGGMDYELVQKELDENETDVIDTLKTFTKLNYVTEKIRNRTWIEYFLGRSESTRQVLQVFNEFKGIVAVGPEVFSHVSSGYEEGIKSLQVETNEESGAKYPILFSLPGKEQTGWSGFPKRIFWAFHQRWILQQVGEELVELFKKIQEF